MLLDHIETTSDELWLSIEGLLKSMEAVPPQETKLGPIRGPNGMFAKRLLELMKQQSELVANLEMGSAAMREARQRQTELSLRGGS